jgi:hypothetical protein
MSGYTGSTTTLPGSLFAGCVNLESFSLAANTTAVNTSGLATFANCPKIRFYNPSSNLNFTVSSDNVMLFKGATLAAANGAGGVVTVPASVSAITAGAFEGAPLTKVDMSGCSIQAIPQYAFRNCTALGEVVFSASTKTISIGAFAGCAITVITLPAALTGLNTGTDGAFIMESLQKVIIPANLGITLMKAHFPAQVVYEVTGGPGAYEVFEDGKLVVKNHVVLFVAGGFSGALTLRSEYGITGFSTSMGTFYEHTGVTSIDMSAANITAIPGNTFRGATNLSSVSFPASLTSVGDYAFQKTTALTSLSFPGGLTSIGQNAFNGSGLASADLSGCTGMTSIGTYAFAGAKALTSVSFPSGLTSIGSYAFQNSGLVSADLSGTSMTSIGSDTFLDAKALSSVTFPSGLTSIGNNAFRNTTALTSLSFPSSLTSIGQSAFSGSSGLTSADLSATGMTSIGQYAFQSAAALTTVTFPSGLTSIGQYAFQNTTALGPVTFPASLTSIGKFAFSNSGITSADMSACTGLTVIDEKTFEKTAKLTSVKLPPNLQSINSYAFSNSGLTSITFPASLTYLFSAFENATALRWVKWPASATKVSVTNYAFSGATSLTHVQLPTLMKDGATDTSIGVEAFKNTSLRVLIMQADQASGLNITSPLLNPDMGLKIYVPDAKVADYKGATGWSAIKDKIYSINDLPAEDDPSNWN